MKIAKIYFDRDIAGCLSGWLAAFKHSTCVGWKIKEAAEQNLHTYRQTERKKERKREWKAEMDKNNLKV